MSKVTFAGYVGKQVGYVAESWFLGADGAMQREYGRGFRHCQCAGANVRKQRATQTTKEKRQERRMTEKTMQKGEEEEEGRREGEKKEKEE